MREALDRKRIVAPERDMDSHPKCKVLAKKEGTDERGDLHGDGLLELSEMLYLVHEVAAVHKLHHEVKAVLQRDGQCVFIILTLDCLSTF